MKLAQLNSFTRAYLECALWSSTDEFDQPLDKSKSLSDFTPKALEIATRDCARFQAAAGERLHILSPEQGGRDFWLSRNGHGAGFFDRGDDAIYDELQTIAQGFGECDVDSYGDGPLMLHTNREVWLKIALDRVAAECLCDA